MKRSIICAALCVWVLMTLSARAESAQPAFGRVFSQDYAAYGEWVTLKYTVCNTLDVNITNVTVSDPLVGEAGYAALLEPGRSCVFSARIRITADCLSSPSMSYDLEGETHTLSAAQGQITLEAAALNAVLSEERREGNRYLVLTVTNAGNSPLYGIKADDQILGDMGAALSVLSSGESARFERLVQGEGTHLCHVSAVSAGFQALEIDSNECRIAADSEDVHQDEGGVLLSAYVQDGSLLVVIDNQGAQTIEEAVLREQTHDLTRTLRFLPAHEKTEVLWTDDSFSEEGALIFELTLPDGQAVSAEPIDAPQIIQSTSSPEAAVPDGLSFRLDDNAQTYRSMMIGAGLALAVLIAALWLTGALRRRRERRRRLKKRQEKRRRQRAIQKSSLQKSEENIP